MVEPVVAGARSFAEDGDHGEAQKLFSLPVAVAGIEDIPDSVVRVERADDQIAVTGGPRQREDFGRLVVADVEVVVDAIVGAQRQERPADVFDKFGLGGLGFGRGRGFLVGCGLRGTKGHA